MLSSLDFRSARRQRAWALKNQFNLDIHLPELAMDNELEQAIQTELLARILEKLNNKPD